MPLYSWMNAPGLQLILRTLAAQGGEARVVGGAVRDTLLGREVGDIDLATNLPPQQVSDALSAAGLKVLPTGIDHGTVMAVTDGKGYEITTLRRDVETDGRHATVAYTDDWQEDAARRDFTMNALYLDAQGTLYDYFKGQDDIKARYVRFIGQAEARIREDVLRLLRYFRFLAQITEVVSPSSLDPEALAACRALAHLLPTLSAERVWKELSRLLSCPHPTPVLRLMKENGILDVILPEATHFARLQALEVQGAISDPVLALAALVETGHADIAKRLRLSNREAGFLVGFADTVPLLAEINDPRALRQALYNHGAALVRGGLLLSVASGNKEKAALLPFIETWERPIFPLSGKDVLKMGLNAGPDVGLLLTQVEAWWREQDFLPDRDACSEKAKSLMHAERF